MGKFVTVIEQGARQNHRLPPAEISRWPKGDRLHLKANRKLASGGRVTNGELVTVKSVGADGEIKLADGRVLDASYP